MSYLAKETSRQRRADPRQILPDCRSILVLGMRYSVGQTDPAAANREPNSTNSGPLDG